MNAEAIARALGGHRAGATWMARCPAHEDRLPSLAIRDGHDGRVLVRCHAGCPQREVIAALRERDLWSASGERNSASAIVKPVTIRSAVSPHPELDAERRTAAALAIWRAAVPATGTPVESYLSSRGLTLRPPAALRFHAAMKHPAGGTWPAMIALVTTGERNTPVGIHRTYLAADASTKAPVVPQKMMLGPCRGGAVRLGELGGGSLLVGEGIETCLAAMQATGRQAWSALSTSGLRSLVLPEAFDDIVVLADGDQPGDAAACAAASRWSREGRRARIARPPAGMDFNDLLLAGQEGRS